MKYYLYKLHFNTPVHLGNAESARSRESAGNAYCADTLFSALCHIAVKAGCLETILNAVNDDALLLSDGMPYDEKELYLPKPLLAPENEVASEHRKYLNRLKYIPLGQFRQYMGFVDGQESFEMTDFRTSFGETQIVKKVSLKETVPSPYSVAVYSFDKDCGIYGLICCENRDIAELFRRLLDMLGLEGIGGRVSAGYGKFTVVSFQKLEDVHENAVRDLAEMLENSGSSSQMILTTSLPDEKALPEIMGNASFSLVKRGGFVFSAALTDYVKKDSQYFFAAGSVFQKRYEGMVHRVGHGLPHPVYRYGKPIFLGVTNDKECSS